MCKVFHKWEDLGEQFIHDAGQFCFASSSSGGEHKVGRKVRCCTNCGDYQYRDGLFWRNCEIVGLSWSKDSPKEYSLCEIGYRRGKGLRGNRPQDFIGTIKLEPVK